MVTIRDRREYAKRYYQEHRDQLNANNKRWYARNRNWFSDYRKLNIDKQKEYSRKSHLKNKDKARDRYLRRNHAMTLEFFNLMVKQQMNCCAICRNPFKNGKDTHLDHRHRDGKTRAILCTRCNCGLGYFGESKDILKSAIQYLTIFN